MLYYIIVNVHIIIQYVHYVGWTGAQEQEGFIDVSCHAMSYSLAKENTEPHIAPDPPVLTQIFYVI